jgi:uncharacterized protein
VQRQDLQSRIAAFLNGSPHAVAGASRDRAKFGNKVLRCYMQHGRPVFPVNPTLSEVEGLPAYPTLAALPRPVHGLSIITPPSITERIIGEAGRLGIRHIWIQPGAESPAAIAAAESHGMNVVSGGPCILVALGFTDH